MGELTPTNLRPELAVSLPLPGFVLLCLQLVLVLFVVRSFEIEQPHHLFPILCLSVAAFAIHAWLPLGYRAGFFALVSLAGIVFVLGWENGAKVIGIGLGLIGICHLPLPFAFRIVLLVLAAALLAGARVDDPAAPFWPVLASMFMFRLIVYVFETRHERTRAPVAHIVAYFFPLPNLCFPLFPVLDFRKFRQGYYNTDAFTIYQTGAAWIVRGLTHLLAYRLIKHYLLPAPYQLRDVLHLAMFLAANYALYLRVSGWFHLVTGVLHLFGFNLPRTHDNYFLASSPSDFWRRINIYWKDFMTQVFFYPTFYALRRHGARMATLLATFTVFLATWILHTYQVFWLRSELTLPGSEAVIWLLAGVLAALSLQLEMRRPRRAAPLPQRRIGLEALDGALLGFRIAGSFLLASLFWACWTLPQFPGYLYAAISTTTAADIAALLGCVLLIGAAGALARLAQHRLSQRDLLWATPRLRLVVPSVAALLLLTAAAMPNINAVLGPPAADVLMALRHESMTPLESAAVVQGYYETIAAVPVQAAPLMALPGLPQKEQAPPAYHSMTRPADSFLENELIPGWSGDISGRRVTINAFGMRDRSGLTREKPAGTCRLAFVGSSVVMGYGIGDDETFCRQLEAGLNAQQAARPMEVLNFGMGMSHAIHRRTLLARTVLAFNPDAVYYVAHQDEYIGTIRHVTRLVERNSALPEYLREVVQRAGVDVRTPPGQTEIRLEPFAPAMVGGVYSDIVHQCRQKGILPVWIYLPMPSVSATTISASELIGLAEKAGFRVLNLANWAEGQARATIMADAHHASAAGHQLIAQRLAAELRTQAEALPKCARP